MQGKLSINIIVDVIFNSNVIMKILLNLKGQNYYLKKPYSLIISKNHKYENYANEN